ncbi:OLC1v1013096C1 [Oldenlandia corymbosa var. corymbosa]|uniref:OLC1v1013096C1 n=1 Tax=Oldenlandia corymbosa var. corymbosa TaxID=529605 RepID=A0AAV1DXG5_OLDCO|nr:OLC1v1013096C1 [Oldenlandia corymbosa var. corymbosa]
MSLSEELSEEDSCRCCMRMRSCRCRPRRRKNTLRKKSIPKRRNNGHLVSNHLMMMVKVKGFMEIAKCYVWIMDVEMIDIISEVEGNNKPIEKDIVPNNLIKEGSRKKKLTSDEMKLLAGQKVVARQVEELDKLVAEIEGASSRNRSIPLTKDQLATLMVGTSGVKEQTWEELIVGSGIGSGKTAEESRV